MRKTHYPHPGAILNEEFLKPTGITPYALAKAIHVPQTRIGQILAGKRRITPETGLRLSKFFNTSEDFWTGLQMDYDLAQTKHLLKNTLAAIKGCLR